MIYSDVAYHGFGVESIPAFGQDFCSSRTEFDVSVLADFGLSDAFRGDLNRGRHRAFLEIVDLSGLGE
jgi:hypothetical protein